MPLKFNERGIAPVLIVVVVSMVAVLGVAYFFLVQKNKANAPIEVVSTELETKSGPDENLNNSQGQSNFSGKIRVASGSAQPTLEPEVIETPEPYNPPAATQEPFVIQPDPTEPPKDSVTAKFKDLSASLVCEAKDGTIETTHLDLFLEGTLETSANIDGVWVRVTDEKIGSTIYAAFLDGSKKLEVDQEFHGEIPSVLDGDDYALKLTPDGRTYTIKFYEGTTDPNFVPESQVIAKLFLSKKCS
jgi:hypothetical protein